MNKEEYYKNHDSEFLPLGFEKDGEDPMFYYSKSLISEEELKGLDIEECYIQKLLFGNTGINKGFCIYTGYHFVWLNCLTPEEAIEVSSKIVAFEEV